MMPPKPPRKSLMTPTITSSYDVVQPTYEDPDASVPSVTDGSQSEVKVKPVPRPRTKIQPNAECNNNTVDSVDKNSSTTSAADSQINGFPADCKRPKPVRPPPKPPASKPATSSKPTAAADGANHCENLNLETTVKPPADNTVRLQTPQTPPPRPPPPSNYYDRLPCVKKRESEIYTDESQQARQSPVSPALSEEVVGLCGTYGYTVFSAIDSTDRPAVPPRPGQSSLPRFASECETSPPQTRPPLPPFKPPPPPSSETPSESVYSEIEYRPYLDVLPEDDDDMMSQTSTLPFGQRHLSGCSSSHRQTTSDTEDINGMLRWLKRVSKSDMCPSLYGLSIQEEMRSFDQRAMNVKKALRLYNLLMMKRKESLRNLITEFRSISDSLDKMEKKTKTIGIAGGTTGAVGGVTAVLGIALAPVTMGTSLIATAVGAGIVATAGGVGAKAAKANKKSVNRMLVDKLVYEYKKNVTDLEQCLDFILCEMNELRRHDIPRLQRAGTQTDSLKMAHLAQFVIRNNMNNDRRTSAHTGGMSSERLLKAFDKEMDQYFTEKDGQKLKKSNKSKFSGRVRLLAKNLQDELDHLNRMWEMFC